MNKFITPLLAAFILSFTTSSHATGTCPASVEYPGTYCATSNGIGDIGEEFDGEERQPVESDDRVRYPDHKNSNPGNSKNKTSAWKTGHNQDKWSRAEREACDRISSENPTDADNKPACPAVSRKKNGKTQTCESSGVASVPDRGNCYKLNGEICINYKITQACAWTRTDNSSITSALDSANAPSLRRLLHLIQDSYAAGVTAASTGGPSSPDVSVYMGVIELQAERNSDGTDVNIHDEEQFPIEGEPSSGLTPEEEAALAGGLLPEDAAAAAEFEQFGY